MSEYSDLKRLFDATERALHRTENERDRLRQERDDLKARVAALEVALAHVSTTLRIVINFREVDEALTVALGLGAMSIDRDLAMAKHVLEGGTPESYKKKVAEALQRLGRGA